MRTQTMISQQKMVMFRLEFAYKNKYWRGEKIINLFHALPLPLFSLLFILSPFSDILSLVLFVCLTWRKEVKKNIQILGKPFYLLNNTKMTWIYGEKIIIIAKGIVCVCTVDQ